MMQNPDVANDRKKIKEKLGIGAVMTDELVDDVLPPRRLNTDEATSASREEQRTPCACACSPCGPGPAPSLARQLAKRGYSDEVTEAVLHRLRRVGLIDDQDFADQWVRSRQAHAERASVRWPPSCARRCRRRVIATALDGIDVATERSAPNNSVGTGFAAVLGEGDDLKVTRRLVGMLARRGYGQSMAVAVVTMHSPLSGSAGGSSSHTFEPGGIASPIRFG